jgi:hypothetical protein
MSSRWERLLDQKPRPIADALVDEVARILAKELSRFPPEVESFESGAEEARFKPLFEPGAPRPSNDVFRVAFNLARMELRREIEAIDEMMRNRRYLPLAPSAYDYLAMIFLSRYLTEQMLSLSEAVQSRLPRATLARCLEETERILLGTTFGA